MEFTNVIRRRKATRKFSNKKIEREKLKKILEAGRIAPTAKNLQPFKIYIIESKEGIRKLDKATKCRYNALTVLLICGDKENSYKKDTFPMYVMDTSIVATHMMLEATNVGVDNIWVELFDAEVLKKEFKIPDNLEPTIILPLGYKSTLCPPSLYHRVRKKLVDIVEYK